MALKKRTTKTGARAPHARKEEPARRSSGTCALCGTSGIAKQTMVRHFETCTQRLPAKSGKVLLLRVSYPYDPRYWLYVEADVRASLQALDDLLRDVWLECCGHMSSFTIAGIHYVVPTDGIMPEYGDRFMHTPIGKVLRPGMRCVYEYDFGSTTELVIDVLAYGPPKAKGGDVCLLARNDAQEFVCSACGRAASLICQECQMEIEGPEDEPRMFFCDSCARSAKAHAHEEDMFMPVVNSPRMGVCGYG